LDNYKDQEFLSKEVSAKVIIITWLLTDPDAEKADLHITGFEAWKWEPLDDVFKCNRDFKAFLFAQNKDSWMRLVNIAWEKVSSIREESILKPKPPEIFQKPPSADKENKPWYKKIYVWIAGALAFLLLLTNLILNFKEIKEWFPSQEKKSVSTIKEGTQEFLKENANEPNTRERTPLYSRTKKRVYDICERIEEDKLNPWLFINIDKMHPVTMHNGKVISYKGVLYEGAPRLVFWSDDFIPPFIEDAIVQVFDETIEECHKNGLEPKPYIDEANSLLLGFILHIYSRMADIDQKLSSTADSKNIGRKQTSLEVGRMRECLKEHYDAALLLASKGKNTN
jgi:hypothetical protein